VSNEQEPVGSLGEEAVKLLAALQDWAQESGGEDIASGAASAFENLNEHIATSAEECKYCPLCHVISAVREVSPEVKQHLAKATFSLMKAAAAAFSDDAEAPPTRDRDSPIERITFSDQPWDDV
jgi:hypothetical protein